MSVFPQQSDSTSGTYALLVGGDRKGALRLGIEVSVLLSESHNLSANPTKLSLESGAQVTDHVIVNPAEVSVVFQMSNVGNGTDEARDAFETLKKLMEGRTLVDLVTEHHLYKDMVITSINPTHQAPFKGRLDFTVNLQQISFVNLQSVGRDPRVLEGGKIEKIMSPPVNAGPQDPKKAEVERSGAATIWDNIKK